MGDVKDNWNTHTVLGIVFAFCCAMLHVIYRIITKNNEKEEPSAAEKVSDSTPVDSSTDVPETRPTTKSKKRAPWKGNSKTEVNHPWLYKNLKGHPGTVLHADLSANGKYLAATCNDGSVILWDIRDLSQKEHKTLRVNLVFDHASLVAWSPDSKAFILQTVQENNILVYKIERKKDGMIGSATQVLKFDKGHTENVIGFGISPNGKFIMSCSSKTDMILWDLKGQKLHTMDTYLMSTYTAKISPCGRFVIATGFTPDVKVMEVCFNKQGEFTQVKKAYELTGHKSGVFDVAFDVDTSHVATISKDGTWRVYRTKINYAQGENPRILETGTYTQTSRPPKIALSPNAEVLAVSVDNSIEFYDTFSGILYDTVENICFDEINYMVFDSSSQYLFVCADRVIRVLHNVCGFFTTIQSCERILSTKQTSATVERLNKTIKDCKATLAKYGK